MNTESNDELGSRSRTLAFGVIGGCICTIMGLAAFFGGMFYPKSGLGNFALLAALLGNIFVLITPVALQSMLFANNKAINKALDEDSDAE